MVRCGACTFWNHSGNPTHAGTCTRIVEDGLRLGWSKAELTDPGGLRTSSEFGCMDGIFKEQAVIERLGEIADGS